MNDFTTLIKDSLEIRIVRLPDEEGDGPILIAPVLNNEDTQVAIFTGENATGKSLFADGIIRALANKAGFEGIIVNMKYRTGGGIRAAFMFGDETNESTGYISARTLTTGFSTCEKRTNPHILILDEPEIGLSPKYQVAMGKRLNSFCGNLPPMTKGIVICTHSKILVQQLNIPFHFLRFGDHLGYQEWLEQDDFNVSEADLEKLLDQGIEQFREISQFLKQP